MSSLLRTSVSVIRFFCVGAFGVGGLIGSLFFAPAARATTGPQAFAGWYKLVETKAGTCDERFEGYYVERTEAGGDLRLSSFHFSDVNLGRQEFDDHLMNITWLARTDADGAFSKTRMLTKATGAVSITVNRAALSGDFLNLWSRTEMSSPTEPSFGFTTHCLYRRTAPPRDPLTP